MDLQHLYTTQKYIKAPSKVPALSKRLSAMLNNRYPMLYGDRIDKQEQQLNRVQIPSPTNSSARTYYVLLWRGDS